MELTQRLECTQEIFSNQSERGFPEQIGFIGICGTKYPVKKGPNKIGRDPQTCNIVLNLNSISRQHAVLNVLNSNEYMLMDLDSANKTKLQDKTLQPYIPHPLKNGDTIQFGQVFGIFRLLEEETDLPMTQALDLPDTPVASRFVSKIHQITTVPESPDVSDRDDSFIAPSQPKQKDAFKSPSTHYIKTSGKTISIQPVGQKKIDNVFWNSSKKSDSFHLHNNSSSINESLISVKSSDTSDINNIHEQDTQVPDVSKNDSIFDANTQVPDINMEKPSSPNIYTMQTQIPITENLNKSKNGDKDVNINCSMDNKENDISIFNAETQQFQPEFKTPSSNHILNKGNVSVDGKEKSKNSSDDIILFDEIDSQPLEENFESQALLPPSPIFPRPSSSNSSLNSSREKKSDEEKLLNNSVKGKSVLVDSPTDCEDFAFLPTQVIPQKPIEIQVEQDDFDILPTQKIQEKVNDDDTTDCEDEIEEVKKKAAKKPEIDEDVTDCEDYLEDEKIAPNKEVNKVNFEDLDTQVIEEDIRFVNDGNNQKPTECNLEDMLTQVIPEETVHEQSNAIIDIEDMPTQVLQVEVPKPENKILKQITSKDLGTFKIPVISPKKQKKKENTPSKVNTVSNDMKVPSSLDDDANYYAATQELFDDLCTQKETSDIPGQDIMIENVQANQSFESSEGEEKIERFVSSLSSQQIRDVVGVTETKVAKLKKMPSDGSDVEVTPRKVTPFKFMDIDLPDSQEIKTSVRLQSKALVTESSSDSDTERESQQNTPIVFKVKKRIPKQTKLDLTKKFDAEMLPTRIITRIRKPTDKFLENNESKDISKSILKSKIITDQEDDINTDIINENISRLKSEKSKNTSGDSSKTSKATKSEKKTDSKTTRSSDESTKSRNKQDKKEDIVNSISIKQETSEPKRRPGRPRKEHAKIKNSKEEISINKSNSETLSEPKRETRGRKKRNSDEKALKEVEPLPEKRKRVKRIEIIDSSPEKEIRKSRRTRSHNGENNKSKNSTGSFVKHEQSTVYNISSESGRDSPNLKRVASKEILLPAKRGRPASALGNSLRATPARRVKTQYVLLTAFPNEEVKIMLEQLGAIIVTDVKQCTVVLTLKIKRTFKLLCAVGLGKPIVGQQWVQACVDNKVIVDPWLYIIHDEATEERFQFNLQQSLISKRNFLKGYNITSTPSAMPSEPEMKLIVECSGGSWKAGGPNWVVVSSRFDQALWHDLVKKGATIVSTEFILGGVMQQRLEIDKYKLC